MKLLKVIYIIDTLEFYGAERSLVAMAKEFKNIIPVFVHLYPGASLKKALSEENIKVYSLNIKSKYGFKEATQKLEEIYLFEEPDIIHSTLFRSDLVARKMKAQFSNIPLVNSWVTNSYSQTRYRNKNLLKRLKLWRAYLMDKFSVKRVDWFLANSFTIEEINRLALSVPKEKTTVIYRGRKASEFTEITSKKKDLLKQQLNLKNKKVILNVGRLIESKGQLELIQIIPSLIKKFPDIILLIAGEGGYREVLDAEIKKENLGDYVKLLGARNDIPELLAVTDYFVFPSYLEGLSGSLIEAMMAGKIIIASDIKENLECVDENTALIFKTGDKEDLLLKLEDVLNDSDLNKKLGKSASKVAKEKFNIYSRTEEYEKFYQLVSN